MHLLCHPLPLLLLQVLIRCHYLFQLNTIWTYFPRLIIFHQMMHRKIPQIVHYLKAGGPSMPGDLEDLLGGLPSSRPSKSSKPRYCKLCGGLGVNLVLLMCLHIYCCCTIYCWKIHVIVFIDIEICLNLSAGCLEAGRHLRPWILRPCLHPCQETLRTFWEDCHHPDHLTAANQGIVCKLV